MRARSLLLLFGLSSVAAIAMAAFSCSSGEPEAVSRRITSRADLIGGPGALGEVGDFLIQNDQIRVIIQGEGYSRGFGLYGGGLIDADLVRPEAIGDSSGRRGYDNFSELFPAFFLRAMRPKTGGIKVLSPSETGDGSAAIVVTGDPADFLFMLKNVNDVALGEGLLFQNEYRLRPGKRYVEITTTVLNQSTTTVELPSPGINQLTGGVDFRVPAGDVLLFGAGNQVFAEGAGFDLRYTLEDLYKTAPPLPALPGLVAPFIATKGPKISYGFASGITDEEASFVRQAKYPSGATTDMVIPFLYSAFTGAFYGAAPRELPSRGSWSFKKFFIVGRGDVASIRDVVHEIRGTATGHLGGRVREESTQAPESGASIVTYDASGRPYNQHTPNDDGSFVGTYAPGKYSYRVVADGRYTTAHVPFEIKENERTSIEIDLPSPGLLGVKVRGEDGRGLPAKCSVVGSYPQAAAGFDPKEFLFDYAVGESRRATDLIKDTDNPRTREYLEEVMFVGASGEASHKVRPGRYRVVCSRGIEYDTAEREVTVEAGALASAELMLRHVVPTPGWISGDYHLHSINSVDSFMDLEERVVQCAAEGLDLALSSDHNFVTDLAPTIAKSGLEGWLQSMVGLEMTTLEVGHFNGFPLRYDPGPITKGSFEWSGKEPKVIFEALRKIGAYGPEATVVQVNHPRDALMGYFNDYNWNPDTGEAENDDSLILAPSGPEFGPEHFDTSFDAIEIFNGKRFELLRHFRVPAVLPPPPLPERIPPAGTILRDEAGKIAYPGGLDDWFVMLDQGRRYTATANSDSHDGEDEAGYPRTYTPTSEDKDRAGDIEELEIVSAMKKQRAMLTNGPLVFPSIDGRGMGEVVPAEGGQATLTIQTRVAPWIEIDTVDVVLNGTVAHHRSGNNESLAAIEVPLSVNRDSWVVVEVKGSRSMWPVVTPHEIPPIQIQDAVGALASGFGVSFAPFGNLQPERVYTTTPYAFTNPIYIDADGDGEWTAPRARQRGLRAVPPAAERASVRSIRPRSMPLLMRVFAEFGAH